MKVVLLRADLKPLTAELKRIGDCLEAFLALQGYFLKPQKIDTSGDAPETSYVDEEKEALRELREQLGKSPPQQEE